MCPKIVTGTVQNFLETKQAHRVGLDGPKLRAIFFSLYIFAKNSNFN